MPSSYPGALDALSTTAANGTMSSGTHPALHNDANAAINAIQATLGVDPQGGEATVAERLDALESGSVPDASTTVKGKVELATDAETQTGTDTARAMTPANLQACTATETRKGVVELATDTETQTGTDTARAMTPANLSARTATETRTGVVELATTAEAAIGTDTARAVTPAGLTAAIKANDRTTVACSDESTAITTGTAKVAFRMVGARTLVGVRASLSTAQASGSIFTVDINKNGTTVLSTKLTIDNTEKTSTTAATAAVISVTSFADDDEITIDVDQIGTSGAKGLKVTLLWA